MKYHCNIDMLGGNRYLIRVVELIEQDGKQIAGKELTRFDWASDLRGGKLREQVEQQAREKLGR